MGNPVLGRVRDPRDRGRSTGSVSFNGLQIGGGGHAVRNNGVELVKGAEADDSRVPEFTLVRHQNHSIAPLDHAAFDLRFQIGTVGQSAFNGDAGSGNKDGLDAQSGKGVQC